MKNINNYILESTTSNKSIQDYGKSWTTEHIPEDFNQMMMFFLKGVREGLEENKKYYSDNKTMLDYIEDSIKEIEEMQQINKKY